jgi:hypothetical protein
MSGSVYYVPKGTKKHGINCSTPSSFKKVVEELFGELPIVLNEEDIPKLSAIAIYQRHEGFNKDENTFDEIIKGINKYKEIELDIEY